MKKTYILLFFLSLFSFGFSQTVIVTVDRANIVGPTDSGNETSISSVGFTRGSGVVLATTSQNFTSSQWAATTQADAVTNDEYIQWSVSASASNSIELTEIDIRTRINNNGPTNWQIFYSLDNFATAGIAVTTVQASANPAANFNFNGLSIVSGTGGTVTFRLYAWNAVNNNGWFRIARRNAWTDFGIAGPGMRLWGTITTTTTNSIESNIITSVFDEPDNIIYTDYSATSGLTTANAIKIGEFTLQDGGDDLIDADALATILTDIEFTVVGNNSIAALAVFDGVTNVGEITGVSSTSVFSNLNGGSGIIASDNSSQTFDIYATFNSTVTDNEQIQLTISSATSDVVSGSTFLDFDAGGAQTSVAGDDNRIEVNATSLTFSQQPTNTNQFETMTPFPVVTAIDGNSNLDLDAVGTITIISGGSLSGDPIDYPLTNGISILNTLVFTEQETAITLFALGSGSLGFTTSNPFDVNGPLITIAIQDFDGALPDWTYTNDIPFFDNGWGTDGFYGIIDIASASPLNYPSFSNNILGENDLNDEGNGTTGFATVIFNTIDISSYNNVNLSFDWQVMGYNNNNDDAQYELIYDGVNQGLVFLHDGNGLPTDGAGTISIDIPSIINTVALRIRIRDNGLIGYSGFDNFKLTSVFNGLLYTNSAWIPNAPSDTTGTEDAYILDGTYLIGSNINLDNLFINFGATTTVAFGQSLTTNTNIVNNGTLELNSVSTSYSSLIVNGSVFGNTTYHRHVNNTAVPGETDSNDFIAPPVTGQTFGAFATANSNIVENPADVSQKLFGPFNKTTGTYQLYDTDIPADANVIFGAGDGYRAASTDNSTFTFTGNVATGNVNVPVVVAGPIQQEWNLIGNPYPSYFTLADWLPANSAQLALSSVGIWGYDGDASDGWTIWNQAYLDIYPNAVVTPGQGFLIASVPGGGTISFTPSMRSTGTTDDFIVGRSAIPNNTSYLKIKATSNQDSRKAEFYFSDNGSLGLDPGYDAITFGGITSDFDIYSHLVEESDGSAISVQTIGNLDIDNNTVIPLGINAYQGQQITISKDNASSTIDSSINVFLEDNLTNTFTSLNGYDYTFTTNTDINGTGRFFLHFSREALSTTENELDGLLIYTTAIPKALFIKGQLNETTELSIYDIQGRLVISKILNISNNIQQIDISNLHTGIYVVQLVNNTQSKSEKIIIR